MLHKLLEAVSKGLQLALDDNELENEPISIQKDVIKNDNATHNLISYYDNLVPIAIKKYCKLHEIKYVVNNIIQKLYNVYQYRHEGWHSWTLPLGITNKDVAEVEFTYEVNGKIDKFILFFTYWLDKEIDKVYVCILDERPQLLEKVGRIDRKFFRTPNSKKLVDEFKDYIKI